MNWRAQLASLEAAETGMAGGDEEPQLLRSTSAAGKKRADRGQTRPCFFGSRRVFWTTPARVTAQTVCGDGGLPVAASLAASVMASVVTSIIASAGSSAAASHAGASAA
jgi:hypothetical protein